MIDGLIRSRHIVHYIVYMTQATISILHYALCIMIVGCGGLSLLESDQVSKVIGDLTGFWGRWEDTMCVKLK